MRRRREFRGLFALRAFEGERFESSLVSPVMRIKQQQTNKGATDTVRGEIRSVVVYSATAANPGI